MTRTRWVSLATDALPTYAVFAPVAAWIWQALGYRPLVFVHDEGWDNPFGELVRHELGACALVVPVPTAPPLSVANTMRTSRLCVGAVEAIADDDLVITADVDMFPLSGTFFEITESFVALRALYHVWEMPSVPKPPTLVRPLSPGEHLFAMCYFAATGGIWREMFPGDDVVALLKSLAPGEDWNANDEAKLSRAALASPRARGELIAHGPGNYQQGELHLVDPITLPNLSGHEHLSRGLVWLEHYFAVQDTPELEQAIDFIPPRFTTTSKPWWGFSVACRFHPEIAGKIVDYVARVGAVIDTGFGTSQGAAP